MATTTTGHMNILPGFKLCRKGLHQYPENKKTCPECHKNSKHEWYKVNKERVKESSQKWRKANLVCAKEHERKKQKKVKERYAAEQQATPSWANKKLIKQIYGQRNLLNSLGGDKYEVDHIYPLNNDFVCGLHIETNLQIIKAKENLCKSNKKWPGQLDCQRESVYAIFPKELTDLLNEKT